MTGFRRAVQGPLASVALTLALGFLIVWAVSDRPVLAYRELLLANFASAGNFALFLNRATPLILIGLGIVFAFRAGVFNVGGEGQLYLGAVAAAWAGLAVGDRLPGLPAPAAWLACLAVAVAAGAAVAYVPAVLKVRLGVDEVVSTLMLNFLVLLLTSYLVTNPLRDPSAYGPTSRMLDEALWLPSIPGLPGAQAGLLLALALVPAGWVALFRTRWGADLRAAGTNPRFAETVGIPAGREVVRAMLVSGGLAGLAGGLYVLGVGHRFEQNFSPAFGLVALTCALLGRIHPVGVLATSLFYAAMLNGAAYMQIATEVPRSLVGLLTGLLVLLMTADVRRLLPRLRPAAGR